MEKTREVDIGLLRGINKSISSRMRLSELMEKILQVAREIARAESSSVLLHDRETGDLIFDVVIGDSGEIITGERVPRGVGIAGRAAETRQSYIVNDPRNDGRFYGDIDLKSGFVTRNLIAVPMLMMDELVGVLEVVNSLNKEEGFTADDLEMARYVAEQAALALTNRMLHDDLRRRVDELSALYEISSSISRAGAHEDILQMLIESLASSMRVERASVMIYDTAKRRLEIKGAYGLPGTDFTAGDDSVSKRVFETGNPIIAADIKKNDAHYPVNNGRRYRTFSFISMPLFYKSTVIGVLNLTDKVSGSQFDSFDLRVLTAAAVQIAEAYLGSLNRVRLEKQKQIERDMEIAAQVQRKFLKGMPETFGGCSIAAYNKPAKEIGGDFYDFFRFDDDRYGILIADISGKGIPAALFMGAVRNIIRAHKEVDFSPSAVLSKSNDSVYQESEYGMFVTVFYAVVDTAARTITYGSAGHNDQLLVRMDGSGVVSLGSRGKPLGIIPGVDYEQCTVSYCTGDMLVMYTDGVVECLGEKDLDIFAGEKRLAETAASFLNDSLDGFIRQLNDLARRSTIAEDHRDDFTVCAVRL